MTAMVCDRCGSDRVFVDAWVGVNDPTDVRTFDATFCDECGDHCTLRRALQFVLTGDELDESGAWLYWSNENGWGDRVSATVFSEAEMAAFSEPQGALGWEVAG